MGCRERSLGVPEGASSEAPGRILGTEQLPFPPSQASLHLDTEAEVGGQPVELAALRHHIHVGLVHVCYILQVPWILCSTGEQDLIQVDPTLELLPPSSQLQRFQAQRGAEK